MNLNQQQRRSDPKCGHVREVSNGYSLVIHIRAVKGDSIIQTHPITPHRSDALYFGCLWLIELEVGAAADPSQRDAVLRHFVHQTFGKAVDDRNGDNQIPSQRKIRELIRILTE